MRDCVFLLSALAGFLAFGQERPASLRALHSYRSLPKASISAMALDRAGNVYVAGNTSSAGLPVTPNAFQRDYHATECPSGWQFTFPCTDAFVVKFDPSGQLVYATYLGGSGDDWATSIAVDAGGNAYVTGGSGSADFPVTPNRLAGASGWGTFVTKINPSGSALVYSTFLPGTHGAAAIAVDAAGQVYVAGSTEDPNLPVTTGALQPLFRGGDYYGDGFLCKLKERGDGLVYATYLGGSGYDSITSLAIDPAGNAYVAGRTTSRDFPITPGAVDTLPPDKEGYWDAFIAKVNPAGSALLYAARPTGSCNDWPKAIAVDAGGRVFVTGSTCSQDFPTSSQAFQREIGLVSSPAFVTVLSPNGRLIVYSTYLGGTGSSEGLAIALDRAGNAVISGWTADWDWPTTPGAPARCQSSPTAGGLSRSFLSRLDARGSSLLFSTYLTGGATAIALNSNGRILVAGPDPEGGASVSEVDPAARLSLALDCIANAANFFPGVVAPGELVTIYGSGIGPEEGVSAQPDPSGVIGATLGSTRVWFDGIPAPILFARADQVNAVAPFALAGRETTNVVVEHAGRRTEPLALSVQDAVPGIFHLSSTNRAAVLNEDGTLNSPSNPARRGSIISLWATGAGLMDPPVRDGAVASPPWSPVRLPVFVYFYGWQGEVLYAGSAPGIVAGVVQVNARIPAEMPANGSAVDLGLQVGATGFLGRVTIAVK